MKAEKVSAELARDNTIYWLASGTVQGRTVIAEGRNRGEAVRAWAAIANARNVHCLPPRRRHSFNAQEWMP